MNLPGGMGLDLASEIGPQKDNTGNTVASTRQRFGRVVFSPARGCVRATREAGRERVKTA